MSKAYTIILGIALVSILVSCEDKKQREAEQMIHMADSLYTSGEYDTALLWLDSLSTTFPADVKSRKKALEMSREIRLSRSRQDSIRFSGQMEMLMHYADSLYNSFNLVVAPDMPDENVIRYRGYNPSVANPSGVYLDCYILSNGTLELVACASATSQLGITFVEISEQGSGSYMVSDTLHYDGALNYRYTDLGRHYERLTFSGKRALRIGDFVAKASPSATLKVDFCREGKGAVVTFQLKGEAREAITKSYRYAQALMELRRINSELEKHEKRLQLKWEREMREEVFGK